MKKIVITGIAKETNRIVFTLKKEPSFFRLFPYFLKALNLEKPGSFYEFENRLDEEKYYLKENDLVTFNLKSDEEVEIELIDIVENTCNENYDVDIFFGKGEVIVVVRMKNDEQQKLTGEMLKIATLR